MILEPISPRDISVSFDVQKIKVVPEVEGNQNVIGKVSFTMTFSSEGYSMTMPGETLLRVFQLTDFKPIDQLTKEDIIQFVISENGGENWLERIKYNFAELLTEQKFAAQMVDHPLPAN